MIDIIVFFQHPVKTYGYAVIFSITGYLGINIVLTLVTTFGALPAVTSKHAEKLGFHCASNLLRIDGVGSSLKYSRWPSWMVYTARMS